jgi:hypothetical protein
VSRCVIQVHQHRVEFRGVDGFQDAGGRSRRFDAVTLALEEEAERLEDVRLVVGNQHARDNRF